MVDLRRPHGEPVDFDPTPHEGVIPPLSTTYKRKLKVDSLDAAGIRAEAARLGKVISRAGDKLKALRESCPHPNRTHKYGSNTGNYDPSSDRYWIDWDCPDCGKHWSTDQ
jgi:hypothetical protein